MGLVSRGVDVAVAGVTENGAVEAVFLEDTVNTVHEHVEPLHGSCHILQNHGVARLAHAGHTREDAVAHGPEVGTLLHCGGERIHACEPAELLQAGSEASGGVGEFCGRRASVVNEHGRGARRKVSSFAKVTAQRGVVHHLHGKGSGIAEVFCLGGGRGHAVEIEHGRGIVGVQRYGVQLSGHDIGEGAFRAYEQVGEYVHGVFVVHEGVHGIARYVLYLVFAGDFFGSLGVGENLAAYFGESGGEFALVVAEALAVCLD